MNEKKAVEIEKEPEFDFRSLPAMPQKKPLIDVESEWRLGPWQEIVDDLLQRIEEGGGTIDEFDEILAKIWTTPRSEWPKALADVVILFASWIELQFELGIPESKLMAKRIKKILVES